MEWNDGMEWNSGISNELRLRTPAVIIGLVLMCVWDSNLIPLAQRS